MSARAILEFTKAVGGVEFLPGFKIVTRDFLKMGQAPFIFIFSGKTIGEMKVAECDSEENAIKMIDLALTEMKNLGYSDEFPLSIPDIRISQGIYTEGQNDI